MDFLIIVLVFINVKRKKCINYLSFGFKFLEIFYFNLTTVDTDIKHYLCIAHNRFWKQMFYH